LTGSLDTGIGLRTSTAEDADLVETRYIGAWRRASVTAGFGHYAGHLTTAQQIGPLGRNLFFTSRDVRSVSYRIVGVVSDVHQAPIGQAAEPVIYHPQRQFPFRSMTIVARGQSTPAVTSGLRQAMRSIDPAVPLSNVQTMSDRLVSATAAPRLLMAVLSTFAILTGLLAAIGVYGLMAWTVNERRRELAIRLALGAQPASLARLVTSHGLGLAAAGVIIGLTAAQLARGLLQTVLFRTSTTDAASIAGAGRGETQEAREDEGGHQAEEHA